MSALSGFLPVVRHWFETRLGRPSPPQEQGWPHIAAGHDTLIAAPTGSGKTLAAFLQALDGLLRQGDDLADTTQVLYISPLKALGNDVQKNLQAPLDEIMALDPSLPEIRVLVRSGDTPKSVRAAMRRRPPHVLVTTPESLYILLTSDSGRDMLRPVRRVIVDEIHALAGNKRGAHLALSLERLAALTGRRPQRIGLSATQKPLVRLARLLTGHGDCKLVDIGHRREIDLAVEIPASPLESVCSHETWSEIYTRMAALIRDHRTTLVFVNTRKLAERVAARLSDILGSERVTSHHGSLSRRRRLEAERRLRNGELAALVATASLELGIDIGDVDLVIQVGVTSSIATLLQRVGRAGHALGRISRGRVFPLTRDELVCAAALLDAVQRGELDETPETPAPLDILAQQAVAACVSETWDEAALLDAFRGAAPYKNLTAAQLEDVLELHGQGRHALLHRDGVNHRVRATRRARITALTAGGAIPDTGQFQVLLEPEGIQVGSLDEDFAIEANVGDIFQLGNTSWRILQVGSGVVRVADARGLPPTLPFWFGEAPARSPELSAALARLRLGAVSGEMAGLPGLPAAAGRQVADFLGEALATLGALPTRECVVAERFFDEAGGMHLVLHAPFGGRINRAWGLALRKRFCRSFGFELQAAANEEAIVISLGPQHSFPLAEVFDYLHPDTVREVLVQAVLATPLFTTRWRWNITRSLLLPRSYGGRRVPTPLLRMRADDLLAAAFPEVLACGETMPAGDLPVPWEHPLVRQTLEDCLTEAMDVEGLRQVLLGLRSGSIRTHAVDTPAPSALAQGVLNVMPYGFLDDAPLEERRTRAVLSRRLLEPGDADSVGALDAAAVERVRQEAWPEPASAEEVHEALLWMGFVAEGEAVAAGWSGWLTALAAAGRVRHEAAAHPAEPGRWLATETAPEPLALLRGRMEALGPVFLDDGQPGTGAAAAHVLPASCAPLMAQLEGEGLVLRCRLQGAWAFCHRRLLARIQRYTLDRLRREIEPVSAAVLWRALARWQHAGEEQRLDGPHGVATVLRQLAGFEAPAAAWESSILPLRVRRYRPEWLDQVTLSGEIMWGRLWGSGSPAARVVPLAFLPRDRFAFWQALAGAGSDTVNRDQLSGAATPELSAPAQAVLAALQLRGALFTQEIQAATQLLPSHLEAGLLELIGDGRLTCDAFAGLRRLLPAPARRRTLRRAPGGPLQTAGRWSLLPAPPRPDDVAAAAAPSPPTPGGIDESIAEEAARLLLDRYGVIFRRLLLRERLPLPWRDLARVYRRLELRGEVRGGRFVAGFTGEQFARPEAVDLLRRTRGQERGAALKVAAADPLNLKGVLTADARVPGQARQKVEVA